MLVHLRDGSAHTVVRAAALREDADQTCYLTQSQCALTGATSSSTDPKTSDDWKGRHMSTNL